MHSSETHHSAMQIPFIGKIPNWQIQSFKFGLVLNIEGKECHWLFVHHYK